MTISTIYDHYSIPPNLRRHQLEVAAVGLHVCRMWNDSSLDSRLITVTLLLHDMGNILKFKRPFFGELEEQAAYWEGVQQRFKTTYGNDVHAATIAIVTELGLNEVASLLHAMRDIGTHPTQKHSRAARICEYADCCVSPEGIVGVDRRIIDLQSRYGLPDHSLTIQKLKENALFIEMESGIDRNSIPRIDYAGYIESFLTIDITP